MREITWSESHIKHALDYDGVFMRVDPRAYPDRREVPKYRPDEVALYLGIKPRTLRNWFFGYHYSARGKKHIADRLVQPAAYNPYGPSLSFYNLAEAQVLAATRQKWTLEPAVEPAILAIARPKFGAKPRRKTDIQVSIQAIRNAIDYVSQWSPVHPLISQYFFTDGKQLFVKQVEEHLGKHGEHLTVNVSRFGQMAFSSILDLYLERIERDSTGPVKVYPLRRADDRDKSIVIMPNVASGRPIIAGTGIKVETIWNRYQSGELPEQLSQDYDIDLSGIEKAISYFADAKAA